MVCVPRWITTSIMEPTRSELFNMISSPDIISSHLLSFSMRVISPMMDPPEMCEEGSTGIMATRWCCAMSFIPSASMKVDFPAPGGPATPILKRPSSGVYICESIVNDLRHGNFIFKSEGNYLIEQATA